MLVTRKAFERKAVLDMIEQLVEKYPAAWLVVSHKYDLNQHHNISIKIQASFDEDKDHVFRIWHKKMWQTAYRDESGFYEWHSRQCYKENTSRTNEFFLSSNDSLDGVRLALHVGAAIVAYDYDEDVWKTSSEVALTWGKLGSDRHLMIAPLLAVLEEIKIVQACSSNLTRHAL